MKPTLNCETEISVIQSTLQGIPQEELTFDDIAFAVSQEIYGMMLKRNMNQKDLASKMQVSEACISKMLSGSTNMTIRTFAKIITALSCEIRIKMCDKDDCSVWYKNNFETYSHFSDNRWKKTRRHSTSHIGIDNVCATA